jgi:hypothetical protein
MTKEKLYKYLDGKLVSEMYDDLISFGITHEKLKFELHPMSFRYDKQKAIRSHGLIKNKWYSIVGGGKGLHGDGVNNFEVWTEKMESEGLDPAGYCTPEEVEELIIDLY